MIYIFGSTLLPIAISNGQLKAKSNNSKVLGIWENLYVIQDITMIWHKPSQRTHDEDKRGTLWIGRLSLTTSRTCLESKGFMPVKIHGASNSHNSQDSKIK